MPPWDLVLRTRLCALAVRKFVRASRRGRSRKEFESKLGTVFEEGDECADHLRYLSESGVRHNPVLLQEARELAMIFAKAVKTLTFPLVSFFPFSTFE